MFRLLPFILEKQFISENSGTDNSNEIRGLLLCKIPVKCSDLLVG